jgi:fructose-bisphosphate aldolase class I
LEIAMKGLEETIRALIGGSRGILAADESTGTITRRFEAHGIDSNPETRSNYRQLLAGTPGLAEFIGGMILFDEEIRQKGTNSTMAALERQGIVPGIKVDKGTAAVGKRPKSRLTLGLDGLQERLGEYHDLGARFTKWRAVLDIGQGMPERSCFEANAQALAVFAKWSQEKELVPIVEPEVLMKGDHGYDLCSEASQEAWRTLFHALTDHGVELRHTLLKANMIVPGEGSGVRMEPDEVADRTLKALRDTVPGSIPGIVFLSGGLDEETATRCLGAVNRKGPQPWELSYSFGRGLQNTALKVWRGDSRNAEAAQQALLHRARCNHQARRGKP